MIKFVDLKIDNNTDEVLSSIFFLSLSLCNLILLPILAHQFDDWSKALNASLSVISFCLLSVSTIISRLVALYNIKYKYQKYKTTLESFEIYIPIATVTFRRAKRLQNIAIFLYVTFVFPVDGLKIWYLLRSHPNYILMPTCFFLYYSQNFGMFLNEVRFAAQCYLLNSKFQDINKELRKLDDEYNQRYAKKYLLPDYKASSAVEDNLPSMVVYERDFYCPKDKGYPIANTVELLRIKHWLCREAINDLNSMFCVLMGLSMFCLVAITLIDVYTEMFYVNTNSMFSKSAFRSKVLFIGWILQNTCRFSLIVISAHTATVQVILFAVKYFLPTT